jgi:glycosyltransferase involved in cell wall biosynthesis
MEHINGNRLVVVPLDPIAAYERAGYDWLERYFNPDGFFQEVFALSPLEQGERYAYGMTIRGVSEREFTHVLRELRPDVVRAYGGCWPADLVGRHRLPDVPVVVSVHDTNPFRLHKSVRYADLVICMSKAVAQQVTTIGTDPSRIRILPNRVDTSIFHPIADHAALQSVARRFPPGKHILHVGRKSEQKNLDTLIGALRFLPTDYSCIFIGVGDTTPYATLAGELGVAERCFWMESVKNSDLPLWYSWCNCMCTPSRWEGFGIVFIEAAACGAVIVTSDIAPMNEYLADGQSACLVKEYENPEALADAIRRMCEDTAYRQMLSEGAVKAAQPFELHNVDAAEVAIYREAMSLGPLSLSRRLEVANWRARERIASLGTFYKRAVRAVKRRVRRVWSLFKGD